MLKVLHSLHIRLEMHMLVYAGMHVWTDRQTERHIDGLMEGWRAGAWKERPRDTEAGQIERWRDESQRDRDR